MGLWNSVPSNKIVGCLFPNDADGNAWGDDKIGLPSALKAAGYQAIDTGRFQPFNNDYTAQITAFKNAGVEIVTGNLTPPDFATFWSQAAQQGLKPKVCTIGKALLFGAVVIADDISFALSEGEALGVLGPNGVCKTTLFGIITGTVPLDSGPVRFAGTAMVGALIFLQKLRVSPDTAFSLNEWTAFIIFISVIGGIGRVEGPVVGTIVFFIMRQTLADLGSIDGTRRHGRAAMPDPCRRCGVRHRPAGCASGAARSRRCSRGA